MPQEPTRWLEPKLLVLIAVQVALSTKFAEFFDRRDAHAHLPETTHPDADHAGGRVPDRLVGGAAVGGPVEPDRGRTGVRLHRRRRAVAGLRRRLRGRVRRHRDDRLTGGARHLDPAEPGGGRTDSCP